MQKGSQSVPDVPIQEEGSGVFLYDMTPNDAGKSNEGPSSHSCVDKPKRDRL